MPDAMDGPEAPSQAPGLTLGIGLAALTSITLITTIAIQVCGYLAMKQSGKTPVTGNCLFELEVKRRKA
jgi:hypothetical protein